MSEPWKTPDMAGKRSELLQGTGNQVPSAGPAINDLLAPGEGYIVGRLGDQLLRHKTDAHLLTIAPTGMGKGVGTVIPNLLDHPGSAFIIDIKGENAQKTANARRLFGQDVHVLDPLNVLEGRFGTASFNPLDVLRPGLDFEARVERLVDALVADREGRRSDDPLWDNVTHILAAGLITLVALREPPEQRHLPRINELLLLRGTARQDWIRDLEALCHDRADKAGGIGEVHDAIRRAMFLLTESHKAEGIPESARQQINAVFSWVGHVAFSHHLKRSTFQMRELAEHPTTIYVVLKQEYLAGYFRWLRILIEAAFLDLPETKASSASLAQSERTLFMLDEFAALGRIDAFKEGMATMRSRGVNIWAIIQSQAQLEELYGAEGARMIREQASALQIFGTDDLTSLDSWQKYIGQATVEIRSMTIGMNQQGSASVGTSSQTTIGSSLSEGQTDTLGESSAITDTAGVAQSRSVTRSGGSNTSVSGKIGGSVSFNGSGNSSTSRTKGQTVSFSRALTAGRNSSRAWSTTHGRSHSTSQGSNRSTTLSEGWQYSHTLKLEEKPVIRMDDLRIVLGKAQLLIIRGQRPLLTPKLRYFEFPTLLALADGLGEAGLPPPPLIPPPKVEGLKMALTEVPKLSATPIRAQLPGLEAIIADWRETKGTAAGSGLDALERELDGAIRSATEGLAQQRTLFGRSMTLQSLVAVALDAAECATRLAEATQRALEETQMLAAGRAAIRKGLASIATDDSLMRDKVKRLKSGREHYQRTVQQIQIAGDQLDKGHTALEAWLVQLGLVRDYLQRYERQRRYYDDMPPPLDMRDWLRRQQPQITSKVARQRLSIAALSVMPELDVFSSHVADLPQPPDLWLRQIRPGSALALSRRRMEDCKRELKRAQLDGRSVIGEVLEALGLQQAHRQHRRAQVKALIDAIGGFRTARRQALDQCVSDYEAARKQVQAKIAEAELHIAKLAEFHRKLEDLQMELGQRTQDLMDGRQILAGNHVHMLHRLSDDLSTAIRWPEWQEAVDNTPTIQANRASAEIARQGEQADLTAILNAQWQASTAVLVSVSELNDEELDEDAFNDDGSPRDVSQYR